MTEDEGKRLTALIAYTLVYQQLPRSIRVNGQTYQYSGNYSSSYFKTYETDPSGVQTVLEVYPNYITYRGSERLELTRQENQVTAAADSSGHHYSSITVSGSTVSVSGQYFTIS